MQFKSSSLAIVPVAAALTFAIACGTAGESEPADPVDTPNAAAPAPEVTVKADNSRNNPILSLDLEAEHDITYYEPVPGFLIMVETTNQHQKSLTAELDSADALKVFAKVRPNVTVPEVLLQAAERARSFNPGEASVPAGAHAASAPHSPMELIPGLVADDGVGKIGQAHSQSNAQDFVANHGGCSWAPIFMVCRVNWNGGFHSGNVHSSSMTGVVDHYSGNGVGVKVAAGGVVHTFFMQNPGTVAHYTTNFSTFFESRFLEVINVTAGDQFHVSVRWS